MYKNLFDLTGKIVVTVGGYGGIGKEASYAFADCGATVVIVGRNIEKAEALAETIIKSGGQAEGLGYDCTGEEGVIQLAEYIKNKYGKLDVLVNFLGGNVREDADKFKVESWEKIMRNNLTSCMLLCRELGKMMIEQKSGKIVLLGSVRSELGLPNEYVGYCAAKGAIKMYAKCLASEWAKYNINVNVVAPTFVATEKPSSMLKNKEFYDNLLKRIPLGRLASPGDVAKAILFFSSPASEFITGQLLLIDGGITTQQ